MALIVRPAYAVPLPQDDSVRAAFELLLKAKSVDGPSVGRTGARTKEYDAFETLWKAGKAAEDYVLKLVWDGTPAARVYGAILLLEFNQAAAEREFLRLEEEITTVTIFRSGCVGRSQTIGDLVRQLKMGKSVIETPSGRGVRRK